MMTYFVNAFTQIDLFTIAAALILFLAARPICRWLSHDDTVSARVSMMRLLNFLIIAAVVTKVLLLNETEWAAKIAQCLIILYFAMLGTQIINFFIRQRFGRVRTSNNKVSISDTYSSRGLSLFVAVVITVIALVSCLRVLGLDSLLEAGGALG
ncbi:MAG: hypothetical protein KJP04_10570, partial [Arenicella sp.]|nr:hypothetical protein [Arenicella sp.]